jgi:subfamily B ATP-binding cassette protein MsbA
MTARFRRVGRQYESDPEAKAKRLNRESLHTFGRLLQYIRPYRRLMTFSIVMLLVSTMLGLVLPLVVQNLVDVVLIDKNLPRLNQLAIGLFIVFIVQALFSFAHRLSLAYVGEGVIATIRIQIYSHLQKLSLKYFADHRTGEVVSRLTNDV